jgi:hypothetical protein
VKLLSKIQDKLHSRPVNKSTGPANNEEANKALLSLPDSEKLKVLDYLSSLKNLHKDEH